MAHHDTDTLADIALYSGYAIDQVRALQATLAKYHGFLGTNGAFLAAASDMLEDIIHDELDPAMHNAAEAQEFNAPLHVSADLADYHARLGVCHAR